MYQIVATFVVKEIFCTLRNLFYTFGLAENMAKQIQRLYNSVQADLSSQGELQKEANHTINCSSRVTIRAFLKTEIFYYQREYVSFATTHRHKFDLRHFKRYI